MKNNYLTINHSETGLERYLFIALGMHIALIAILFMLNSVLDLSFFSSKKNKNVKVIQSAVRVDVVGMPKFTVQELKKMKVTSTISSEESSSEKNNASDDKEDSFKKMDKKIDKDKKVDLSKLLQNLSNKKVLKAKINNKNRPRPTLDKKALRSLILEGNKVSKGSAIVGDSLAQQQTLFNSYISNLPNIVRPNWKLPSYLMQQDLKCRVRIYISASGKILKTELFETSGVREFDKKALKAIRLSDPLPAPVNEILGRVSAGDVILGFPL